jgi:PncC family amidohydrolase
MKALLPLAEKIAACLIGRKQTIAIAESSTGGLVAAALLAVPGASAYFLGGAVVYTKSARAALLGIRDAEMQGLRPATEDYSLLIARLVRERHGATWGFGETGATGRPATATAILRGTPAWRSPVRQSGRLRYAQAIATDWRIWMLLRRVRSNFLLK